MGAQQSYYELGMRRLVVIKNIQSLNFFEHRVIPFFFLLRQGLPQVQRRLRSLCILSFVCPFHKTMWNTKITHQNLVTWTFCHMDIWSKFGPIGWTKAIRPLTVRNLIYEIWIWFLKHFFISNSALFFYIIHAATSNRKSGKNDRNLENYRLEMRDKSFLQIVQSRGICPMGLPMSKWSLGYWYWSNDRVSKLASFRGID